MRTRIHRALRFITVAPCLLWGWITTNPAWAVLPSEEVEAIFGTDLSRYFSVNLLELENLSICVPPEVYEPYPYEDLITNLNTIAAWGTSGLDLLNCLKILLDETQTKVRLIAIKDKTRILSAGFLSEIALRNAPMPLLVVTYPNTKIEKDDVARYVFNPKSKALEELDILSRLGKQQSGSYLLVNILSHIVSFLEISALHKEHLVRSSSTSQPISLDTLWRAYCKNPDSFFLMPHLERLLNVFLGKRHNKEEEYITKADVVKRMRTYYQAPEAAKVVLGFWCNDRFIGEFPIFRRLFPGYLPVFQSPNTPALSKKDISFLKRLWKCMQDAETESPYGTSPTQQHIGSLLKTLRLASITSPATSQP